ncbi:hypothetical protein ACFC4G_01445 [Streptomyces sp. NPDC056002]|uniref:hypothetical protein n=1 Tax=Streptomyces sp. NPDC056002 TaxID=3345675 RepID=UPI0035E356F9
MVRLRGERYPSGDALYPPYVLVAVAGAVGVCVVAGIAVGARRHSRSQPADRRPCAALTPG